MTKRATFAIAVAIARRLALHPATEAGDDSESDGEVGSPIGWGRRGH